MAHSEREKGANEKADEYLLDRREFLRSAGRAGFGIFSIGGVFLINDVTKGALVDPLTPSEGNEEKCTCSACTCGCLCASCDECGCVCSCDCGCNCVCADCDCNCGSCTCDCNCTCPCNCACPCPCTMNPSANDYQAAHVPAHTPNHVSPHQNNYVTLGQQKSQGAQGIDEFNAYARNLNPAYSQDATNGQVRPYAAERDGYRDTTLNGNDQTNHNANYTQTFQVQLSPNSESSWKWTYEHTPG